MWTYGYSLAADGVPLVSASCGQAAAMGCNDDDERTGVVLREVFAVLKR